MKNLLKSSAKHILIPLGLTESASAAVAGIHKKVLGSGSCPLEFNNIKWRNGSNPGNS